MALLRTEVSRVNKNVMMYTKYLLLYCFCIICDAISFGAKILDVSENLIGRWIRVESGYALVLDIL